MSADIKVIGKTNLACYTTLKVGGNAECLVEAFTEEGIKRAVRESAIILGKGSNVLCGDVAGLVCINRTETIERDGDILRADSGVGLITLSRIAAAKGLGGIEWACGIPGSVGGAARMNASSFGNAFADKLIRLKVIKADGNVEWVSKSDINFAYRRGCEDVVLKAEFKLDPTPREEIENAMRIFTAKRFALQPKGRSLGSVFKNPLGAGMKSAAYYIEMCGLKGFTYHGLKVSEKHANFILNVGGARPKDFLTVTGIIKSAVYSKFGITLENEFETIGEIL